MNNNANADHEVLHLSQQTKDTVLRTWKILAADPVTHGVMMFMRMFQIAPEVLGLFSFKGDLPLEKSQGLRKHAGAFMLTLGESIAYGLQVSDADTMRRNLSDLAARHAKYGVEVTDLDAVGKCLIYVLEKALRRDFNPQVKQAWNRTWAAFQDIMEPALIAAQNPVADDFAYFNFHYVDHEALSIVRTTWVQVSANKEDYGIDMFLHLFKLVPTIKALFSFREEEPLGESERFVLHCRKYMTKFGYCVQRMEHKRIIIPYLQTMAMTHARYGVLPEHFVFMGKALMHALSGGLGRGWTAEVEAAWQNVWTAMESVMKPVLKKAVENMQEEKALKAPNAAGPDSKPLAAAENGNASPPGPLIPKQSGAPAGSTLQGAPPDAAARPASQPQTVPPPQSAPPASQPAFHFVGSCLLQSLQGGRFKPVGMAESFGQEGYAGVVIMSTPGAVARQLLCYDKKKAPLLRCDIVSEQLVVDLDSSLPNTYRFGLNGEVYKLTLKTPTEKSKFALQLCLATRLTWPPQPSLVSGVDLDLGEGDPVDGGDAVGVKYFCWMEESEGVIGSLIDTNEAAEAAQLEFVIGAGKVLAGLELGVRGMRLQGRRRLAVPASLVGAGAGLNVAGLPHGAVLHLEVTVVSCMRGGAAEGAGSGRGSPLMAASTEGMAASEASAQQRMHAGGAEGGSAGANGGAERQVGGAGAEEGGGRASERQSEGGGDAQGLLRPAGVATGMRSPSPTRRSGLGRRRSMEITMPAPPDRTVPSSPTRKDAWVRQKAAAPKNAVQLYAYKNSAAPFFFQGTCYLSKLSSGDETFQPYVSDDCFKPDGLLGVVVMPGGDDGVRKVLVYNKTKQKVMEALLRAATQVHLSGKAANSLTLVDEAGEHWGLRFGSDEQHIKFCTEVVMARCAAWNEEDHALLVQDMLQGSGPPAGTRDMVVLRYTGWLDGAGVKGTLGDQFDSNEGEGQEPLVLVLGEGKGIWALEEGVVGMKEGGSRRLVVHAALGSSGQAGLTDKVPANAILHFCVTLVGLSSWKDEDVATTTTMPRRAQTMASFSGTTFGMMGTSQRTIESQDYSSASYMRRGDSESAGEPEESPTNAYTSKFSFPYAGTGMLYRRGPDGTLQLVQAGGYDSEGSLGVVIVAGEDGSKSLLVYAPVLQAEMRSEEDMKASENDTSFALRDDQGKSWTFRLHDEGHRAEFLKHIQRGNSEQSNRSAGGNVLSQEDINSPTPSITNRPPPPERPF